VAAYISFEDKQSDQTDILDECPVQDFWVLGADISELEAAALRVPIRIGPNNERFVWCDDIDPK
jgi:hypothetical protein